jgi:hypothetical protein
LFPKELEELNEKNSLSEIVRVLYKQLGREKTATLTMSHRSFGMTHVFLPKIWTRILEDAELQNQYWKIQAELLDPAAERRSPTSEETQILERYSQQWCLLNLDMEDWFLHGHILMEKFSKLARELLILTSKDEESVKHTRNIPFRSFHDHINFFLNPENTNIDDDGYCKILTEATSWYIPDLKDVRDDLIQHEIVARFWGYSSSSSKLKISRFRYSEKTKDELYALRDKYAPIYLGLANEKSFFGLLSLFEKKVIKMEPHESERVKQIRKTYGRDFPDIPILYSKMNHFFSKVNDHFTSLLLDSIR